MITVSLDREDLDLIIDFMSIGLGTAKENLDEAQREGWTGLSLRMQHEVDQAEAVLEQLENYQ